MAFISNSQLEAISQSLSDISAQTSQLRISAIRSGTPPNDSNVKQLLGLSLQLSDLAANFAVRAAEVTLSDAADAAATVNAATGEANRALDHLQSVDKAINIASAVVVLATAVFTADPAQIASAAKGVFDAASG